jgi:hypothetical protein
VFWGMLRMLNGANRVVFWLGQAIALVVSVAFVLDDSSGDPQVPVVTGLAAALAIVLSLTPPASRWVATGGGEREPRAKKRHDARSNGETDAGLTVITESARRQG